MRARGLGRMYKRGNIWWVQYWFRGKLHRESTKSKKQKAAKDLLQKRNAEMGKGQLLGPSVERTTFENLKDMLVTDYKINGRKSLERVNSSVKHLSAFFGESRAVDITADRVAAYIKSRLEATPPAKPATIRNE